jgi:hypothetical protein
MFLKKIFLRIKNLAEPEPCALRALNQINDPKIIKVVHSVRGAFPAAKIPHFLRGILSTG